MPCDDRGCHIAGFLESNDRGTYTVTDRLFEAEVHQMLDDLDEYGRTLAEGPARDIASNIKLIAVCMQALPDLLTGGPPTKTCPHPALLSRIARGYHGYFSHNQ